MSESIVFMQEVRYQFSKGDIVMHEGKKYRVTSINRVTALPNGGALVIGRYKRVE